MVGDRGRRAHSLLSVSAALSYSRWTGRFLFYSRQSRWQTLQSWLWRASRVADRSHREKTAESFSAWYTRVQHGNCRLQHGLFFLPELGHFEISPGSSKRARRASRRSPAARTKLRLRFDCLHLQRADDLGRVHHRYLPCRESLRTQDCDG